MEILARGVLHPIGKGAAGVEPADVALPPDCIVFCVAEINMSDDELRDTVAYLASVPDFMPLAVMPGEGFLPVAGPSSGNTAQVEEPDVAAVGAAGEGSEKQTECNLGATDGSGRRLTDERVRSFTPASPAYENGQTTADPDTADMRDDDPARCKIPALERDVLSSTNLETAGAIAAGGDQNGTTKVIVIAPPILDSGPNQHPIAQVTTPDLWQGRVMRDEPNGNRKVTDHSRAVEAVRKPPDLWMQADAVVALSPDETESLHALGLTAKPRQGGKSSEHWARDFRAITSPLVDAAQDITPETGKPSRVEERDGDAARETGPESGKNEPDGREQLLKPAAPQATVEAKPIIHADDFRAVGHGMAAAWPPELNFGLLVADLPDALAAGGAVWTAPEAVHSSHKLAHIPSSLVPALISQVSDAREQPVTLVVSPEELGALRFEVQERGDTVHVTLTVERPETLDLLRRHADQLVGEFRHAGFTGATFSFFGNGGGNGERAAQQPYQQLTKAEAEDASPVLPRRTTSGLDLRI